MALTPEQKRRYAETQRRKYAEDPEYRAKVLARNRERRLRNPEPDRAKQALWRAANREQILVRQAEWRAANRERLRVKQREYNTANREQVLARLMYANHGIWPDQWAAIWNAQDGICYLCRKPLDPGSAALDHDHSCCPKGKSCQACRRGLVHDGCNAGIGIFLDDPDLMERVAAELRAAKLAVELRKAATVIQDVLFSEETA